MTTDIDRPLLGILLMTGFCVLAPLGDGMAKYLGAAIPVFQIVTIRFLAQTLMLMPLMSISGKGGRGWRMTRRVFWLTVVRTVLHVSGLGLLYAALQYLPLADAIAIVFVMPFMLLLLGKFVLKEEVGPRRLAACGVGFIGTLLVIQPSFLSVGLIAVLPLLVALSFALFMLVTRLIARDTDAITLQAVSGLTASVVLVPVMLAFIGSDHALLAPILAPVEATAFQWLVLLAMGVAGTLGHLLMTSALRFAPAATLAPMQYLEIPFATLFGWLMFQELPNGLSAVGIMITVAAGLYIVARERNLSRGKAPTPPRPMPLPEQ
ncbi:drug/metabolite transporter (DMT)-like permease [Rhodobacteraceae bacterium MBR-64]